jgi:hypothetical protein
VTQTEHSGLYRKTEINVPFDKYLQQRNIRLHALYMTMCITATLNAGILRWFVRLMNFVTHCPARTESETTIVVQGLALHFVAMVELLILSMLYTTMTLEERTSRAARYTYAWYVLHATVICVASACLKLPFGIRCDDEGASATGASLIVANEL